MNFPHQPNQLTPTWLTDTLRQAGVLHKAQVTSFELKPISETAGLLGQNAIIRLAYDTSEESAPPSLFAKFAVSDTGLHVHLRSSYIQEVRFYQRFAQRVALPTPRAYFSAFDEATGYFLILLEDCSYGEVGDRITSCSLERVRLVIAEIAQFHATWWEHPEVPQYLGKYTPEAIANWQAGYIDQANRVDDIPEIPRDSELVRTIKEHSQQFARVMTHQQKKPIPWHTMTITWVTSSLSRRTRQPKCSFLTGKICRLDMGQRMSPFFWVRVCR